MVRDIVLTSEQQQRLLANQQAARQKFVQRTRQLWSGSNTEELRARQRAVAVAWWRGLSPEQLENVRKQEHERRVARHKTQNPEHPPRTLDATTYQLCLQVAPKLGYTPNWNYVESRGRAGYVLVQCPNHPFCTPLGYVPVHRLVMECKLGRRLTRAEVVHHIDGNPRNNSATNLVCTTLALHAKMHARPRTMASLKCGCCGRDFEREKRQCKPTRSGLAFCSRACGYKSRCVPHVPAALLDKAIVP